ncbi:CvpA family protein [Rhodoplanes roseus]|uniref:Colicin V production protein n=1 Tax=Rhodoplanes roseus TaxID=29409 RepID=A0A327KLP5_9BRAD|nr:CvpA family protein [Rhodoplanes roseus]RAI39181.1 hypothetical protein CH341_26355 [Rhodoplanes roseus]
MDLSAINSFDAVIGALAVMAALMGFATGLLRSLATILGYGAAVPVAMWATPSVTTMVAGQSGGAEVPQAVIFGAVLVASGLVLGRLLRAFVAAFVAPIVSLPDRLLGAMLGAGRIGLIAVVLVLVFDRIVPAHLQPSALAESRLRPVLASAGSAGLRTLPPEIEAFIDRLKRERGL